MSDPTYNLLAPILSGFLNKYLPHERGLSALTRASYAQTFIILLDYLMVHAKKNIDTMTVEDITPDQVSAFLQWLEDTRGNSRSTRNLRLAALRTFFRYVGWIAPGTLDQCSRIRTMKAKKADYPIIDWLTVEETAAVIRVPSATTFDGTLDRAMLLFTYACGLRVSEVLNLSFNDVDLGSKPSVHILGKGRRSRVLPLAPNTVRLLKAWLKIRKPQAHDTVFVNRFGEPLSRDAFALRLVKYAKVAAATVPSIAKKKVTPHVLRHSCAMHMLKATADIRKVALWLGHASITTTEIYLHADPDEKLEILTTQRSLGIKAGKFDDRASATMAMLKAVREGNEGLEVVAKLSRRTNTHRRTLQNYIEPISG